MVEIPVWMYYLGMVFALIAVFAFLAWNNGRKISKKVIDKETGWQKILIDFRQPDGFMPRLLVPIDKNGKTVTINNGLYRLSEVRKLDVEDIGEEGVRGDSKKGGQTFRPFPVLRHAKYPQHPFMGFGKQVTLRLEEYQEGNPEPVHPFYCKFVDENGKACDPDTPSALVKYGRIMMTASEFLGIVNQMHLAAAAEAMEEIKAREKTFMAALANMPTRGLILMLGLGVGGIGAITLFVVFGIKSFLGA